jgi:hypothetical protein
MNRLTYRFLSKCKKYGLKRVCIYVSHPIVPESMDFCFGPQDSVFGIKSLIDNSNDQFGWPAIWTVAKEMEMNNGCGNGNQYQIGRGSGLEAGAYRCWGGKWKKL